MVAGAAQESCDKSQHSKECSVELWLSAKCVENGTHSECHGGRSLQDAGECVGNGLRAVPVRWHFNTSGGEPELFNGLGFTEFLT